MSTRRQSTSLNRDEFVERYRQLSEQSESIRQRLSLNVSIFESSSPLESVSPLSLPERTISPSHHHEYSYPAPSVWLPPQAVSSSSAAGPEQVDEAILYEISQQIKTTLTELLNCDSVKRDRMFRAWVQARLMDAEHELKRQRKRRSSVTQDTLRVFSEHLTHTPGFM